MPQNEGLLQPIHFLPGRLLLLDVFDVVRTVFHLQSDSSGHGLKAYRLIFEAQVAVGPSVTVEWNGDHVPIGIYIFPNITALTDTGAAGQFTFDLGVFEHQIAGLPPAGSFFRPTHGLDDDRTGETDLESTLLHADRRYFTAWKLYCSGIHRLTC